MSSSVPSSEIRRAVFGLRLNRARIAPDVALRARRVGASEETQREGLNGRERRLLDADLLDQSRNLSGRVGVLRAR